MPEPDAPAPKDSPPSRRERPARTRWPLLLLGNLAWAAAMAGSAWASLELAGWGTDEAIRRVGRIFFAGGLLAYLPAVFSARLLVAGHRPETRFAAHTVALAVATIAVTAVTFALVYRAYYAAWHAPAFTLEWAFEFGFTVASALYQFAVAGLRLYMPFGLAALLVFGLWHIKIAR